MIIGQNVKHLTFGNGKVVDVVLRLHLPNLIAVRFFNGEVKKFPTDSKKIVDA